MPILKKKRKIFTYWVIPEINAGAASVVYGLAVNPVIGISTFLAQLVLRDSLQKVLTYEYKVSGTWDDPVITKIERKPHKSKSAPQTKQNSKKEAKP